MYKTIKSKNCMQWKKLFRILMSALISRILIKEIRQIVVNYIFFHQTPDKFRMTLTVFSAIFHEIFLLQCCCFLYIHGILLYLSVTLATIIQTYVLYILACWKTSLEDAYLQKNNFKLQKKMIFLRSRRGWNLQWSKETTNLK